MSKPYLHYAWPMSLYSGKTRAYLRYKGLHFVEKPIRLWTFGTINKRVGARVMPVVVTPEGQWLQDTSYIIDVLERRHADAPIVPATPRQRLVAYLLEAWGDEFWLPAAMHYRWSFAENFERLFRPEGGDLLLPFAPRTVQNALIDRAAGRMRGYLCGLGVIPAQIPAIEAWTRAMLDALEVHFAQMPYLLGTRPSLGDFGLIGPLYAHLARDPYPARELLAPRPRLRAWVHRMQQPEASRGGDFLADDDVPQTLAPLLHSVFEEFWPQLVQTQRRVENALPGLAAGRGFPRALGSVCTTLRGCPFASSARPYSLWMAQRALDAHRALPSREQALVRDWLAAIGGTQVLALAIRPRLRRMALHVAPE